MVLVERRVTNLSTVEDTRMVDGGVSIEAEEPRAAEMSQLKYI